GERYDLVVVGAGISGLAAAWYFRKAAGRSARILILDNHDDFGGHARRNEFQVGGRTLIGYGGTFAIDSPAPYSATARAMLAELGVDVSRWARMFERSLYASLGMGAAIFFDRETFGADRLVREPAGGGPWSAFLAPAPGPGMGLDARPGPRSPFLHFPDGNATLARLLVQRLIPRAVPGRNVDDVVVARTDYARLDEPGPARLRLNSTVVRARHTGDAA